MLQARELEVQIASKQKQKNDAKSKEEAEERAEWEKLERERLEMAAAFAREQADGAKKNEEDRKRDLDAQIEERRRNKALEEAKERAEEEKENARLAIDQEELRRKEEVEMARERYLEEKGVLPPLSPRAAVGPDEAAVVVAAEAAAEEAARMETTRAAATEARRRSLFDPPSPAVGAAAAAAALDNTFAASVSVPALQLPGDGSGGNRRPSSAYEPDGDSSPVDMGRVEQQQQQRPSVREERGGLGPRRASIQRSDGLMGPHRYNLPAAAAAADQDQLQPFAQAAAAPLSLLPQPSPHDDPKVEQLQQDLGRAQQEQLLAKAELDGLRKLVQEKRAASAQRAEDARERERRQEARQSELEAQLKLLAAHVGSSPTRPLSTSTSPASDKMGPSEESQTKKARDKDKSRAGRRKRRESREAQLEAAVRRAGLGDVLDDADGARYDLGLDADAMAAMAGDAPTDARGEVCGHGHGHGQNSPKQSLLVDVPSGATLDTVSRFVFPDGSSFALDSARDQKDDGDDDNNKNKNKNKNKKGEEKDKRGSEGSPRGQSLIAFPTNGGDSDRDGDVMLRDADERDGPTPAESFRSLRDLAQRREERRREAEADEAAKEAGSRITAVVKPEVPRLVIGGPPEPLGAAGAGVGGPKMTARSRIMSARSNRGSAGGPRSRNGGARGGTISEEAGVAQPSPGTPVEFDVERELLRNARKWKLLQQLDGDDGAVPVGVDPARVGTGARASGVPGGRHSSEVNNDVALSVLLGMGNITSAPASRPSTVDDSAAGQYSSDYPDYADCASGLIESSAAGLMRPRAMTPLDDLAAGVVHVQGGMAGMRVAQGHGHGQRQPGGLMGQAGLRVLQPRPAAQYVLGGMYDAPGQPLRPPAPLPAPLPSLDTYDPAFASYDVDTNIDYSDFGL